MNNREILVRLIDIQTEIGLYISGTELDPMSQEVLANICSSINNLAMSLESEGPMAENAPQTPEKPQATPIPAVSIFDKLNEDLGNEILVKECSLEDGDFEDSLVVLDDPGLRTGWPELWEVLQDDSAKLTEESDVFGDCYVWKPPVDAKDKKLVYRFYMIGDDDEDEDEIAPNPEEMKAAMAEQYDTSITMINNIMKLRNFVVNKCADLADVKIDSCQVIERKRLKQNKKKFQRYYAHTYHKPKIICISKDLFKLPINKVFAILLHEYGHVACGHSSREKEEAGEINANLWVLTNLGIKIDYVGDLQLQTIKDEDCFAILNRCEEKET